MSCKVGNQTNSQDPQAVNSRVFVGNLNTFQCSKTDVERRFQRYGRIAGISMHKGYAFIQFTNPFDARSACLGEDARLLWGQTLDVNLVAEPKPHQTGRKRQNVAKTGNDWDYYYDSYYAQLGFPTPRPILPPMKRPRIHLPPNQPQQRSMPLNKPTSPNNKNHQNHLSNNNTSFADLKSYSTPDILICGNCREMFTEVEQLMEHKKTYCKLRFTCKCHMLNGFKAKSPGEEHAALLCSQCKDSFESAWDLMVHVQSAHMLNIYTLGGAEANKESEDIKEEDGIICGNNGTAMDDSVEHHHHNNLHQQSPNSTLVSLGTSTSTSGCTPYLTSYPTQNGLVLPGSCSSTLEENHNHRGDITTGGIISPLQKIQQFNTLRPTHSCTSSLIFPMEASTQTTTDHSSSTVEAKPFSSILSTKTEPSLLLTMANGQA